MIFEILFFFEFAFYQVYNFNFCKVWETCAKVKKEIQTTCCSYDQNEEKSFN